MSGSVNVYLSSVSCGGYSPCQCQELHCRFVNSSGNLDGWGKWEWKLRCVNNRISILWTTPSGIGQYSSHSGTSVGFCSYCSALSFIGSPLSSLLPVALLPYSWTVLLSLLFLALVYFHSSDYPRHDGFCTGTVSLALKPSIHSAFSRPDVPSSWVLWVVLGDVILLTHVGAGRAPGNISRLGH